LGPVTPARAFLFSLEQLGIKLGLEQIRALLLALDHPERAFASVLIAGTNGKGSVAAMVERGLRSAGYRTGRYTSPHLERIEDRVAIDGEAIAPDAFDAAALRVQTASRALSTPPSFFEATTALALDSFRAAQVDVAVLEVGLGGRLDATNAVAPLAVVITLVDLDHEAHLGETRRVIAREKAGVIKPGNLVVLGANPAEVEAVVEETCRTQRARLIHAPRHTVLSARLSAGHAILDMTTPRGRHRDVTLSLAGRHQIENARTAVCLLEALHVEHPFRIPRSAVRDAVEDVVWPGRLELVDLDGRQVLLDGAHNPSGAGALAAFLRERYGRPLPMVIGLLRDKPAPAVLACLADVASQFIFTATPGDRAATPASLAAAAKDAPPSGPVATTADPIEAVRLAARGGEPVVVAGSLYLVGAVRSRLS
jgi:dihydrofolate synthase/folylpolyglutamate synthase